MSFSKSSSWDTRKFCEMKNYLSAFKKIKLYEKRQIKCMFNNQFSNKIQNNFPKMIKEFKKTEV